MINPLKVATSGYLKIGANAALVIAVAGYLSFGGGVVPSEPTRDTHDGFAKNELYNKKVSKERVLQDDDEVMLIIKAFLECQ